MPRPTRARVVLFLHIPKTGGTTLNRLVYANSMPPLSKIEIQERSWADDFVSYTPDGIYHVEGGFYDAFSPTDLDRVRARVDRASARILLGHFSFGLHRLFARPSTYITLLREPVERIVSLYSHLVRFEDDASGVISSKLSLSEFASLPAATNDQARRLSGLEPQATRQSRVLEVAKKNLQRYFSLVGVTERFDEFVVLLRRTLGWTTINYLPHLVDHRRPDRETLAPGLSEAITQANVLDIELYEYAKDLFGERVRAEGAELEREVAEFRRDNERYREARAWRPVDLNTATVEQLMTLPSIGLSIARRIVSYREQNGGFESFEALLNVPGIGRARRQELINLVLP